MDSVYGEECQPPLAVLSLEIALNCSDELYIKDATQR